MSKFTLRDKDFSFNASLSPMVVLERMGFLPASIYREGDLIRVHCPIHKDLVRKSLILDASEKTYRCQFSGCEAYHGGLLVELVAMYYACTLDDVPGRLFSESRETRAAKELVFRGEMYINQGRPSEALPYFEQAVAQNGNDEITRCKMAALYLELNKKDEAYREYMRAAESYAVRGELDKTLAIYNILVMLQPGAVKARKQLAFLFSRLGRPDAAAEQLKWVIDFYYQYGQSNAALDACEQMIEADAQNPIVHKIKGRLLLADNKRVPAMTCFEESARLFVEKGERDDAFEMLKEAEELAPDNSRLKKLRSLAERLIGAPTKPSARTPAETSAAEEEFIDWLRGVDEKLELFGGDEQQVAQELETELRQKTTTGVGTATPAPPQQPDPAPPAPAAAPAPPPAPPQPAVGSAYNLPAVGRPLASPAATPQQSHELPDDLELPESGPGAGASASGPSTARLQVLTPAQQAAPAPAAPAIPFEIKPVGPPRPVGRPRLATPAVAPSASSDPPSSTGLRPAAPAAAAPAATPGAAQRPDTQTAEIAPEDQRVNLFLADMKDLSGDQVDRMREELVRMFQDSRKTYEQGDLADWEMRVIKEFYKAFTVAANMRKIAPGGIPPLPEHLQDRPPSPPSGA